MNNNQNPEMQKRMLIFTVIVFVLFLAYEFLVLKPQKEANAAKQAAQTQTTKNVAPTSQSNANVAPSNTNNNALSALSSKTVASKDILTVIKTARNKIELDQFGQIAQVTLTEEKYKDEDGQSIQLFEANQLRPLQIRLANANLNDEAFKVPYTTTAKSVDATQSKQTVVFTQKLSGTTITKTITFFPKGNYEINVKTTNNEEFFITDGFRPNVLVDMYADHGAVVRQSDETLNILLDEKVSKSESFNGVQFISNFDRYYATVLYNFDNLLQVSVMPDANENPQVFIHGKNNITLGGYAGPKNHKVLHALHPELTDVIEYGWFTFIAKPMFQLLQFIQSYVGNWGWTIVILTILIKLVLYPLSYKGMVSMQKLKDLAPKMKEIQTKYKDDKQKQSMHMMELYKKHGANPMGGCLPLILQIPVFFAIYRVLLNAIELKGAPWILWIHDLALMDPYYVLPILMGASMYLQQKITPNTMQDEMQKKIFQFLPVVFTFFFLWFPAGLTLYWFVNNVFTIVQQYTINKMFEKKRASKK